MAVDAIQQLFPPEKQQESIYILFDTNYSEYYERIRLLSNDLDEWEGKFIPRLNYIGTLCLIQVKVRGNLYSWIKPQDPAIIGIGDRDWAYNQTRGISDWLQRAYNPWEIHRDFCTGKITKEEYEQLLEEGRDYLITKKVKK